MACSVRKEIEQTLIETKRQVKDAANKFVANMLNDKYERYKRRLESHIVQCDICRKEQEDARTT